RKPGGETQGRKALHRTPGLEWLHPTACGRLLEISLAAVGFPAVSRRIRLCGAARPWSAAPSAERRRRAAARSAFPTPRAFPAAAVAVCNGMRQTLSEIYEARVAGGSLRPDPAQHEVLPVLEGLRAWLEQNATRKV